MKTVVSIFLVTLAINMCYGQVGLFEKYSNLGDNGEGVTNIIRISEQEGVVISTGEVIASDDGWHMIMRKLNFEDGSVLFKKDFSPFLNFGIETTSFVSNSSQNYLVTGLIQNEADTIFLGGDVFLCEMNAMGDILWSNSIGTYPVREWGRDIIETEDNGYIIVGHKERYLGANIQDAFVLKTSSQGDSLWMLTVADTLGTSNWRAKIVEKGVNNTCYIGIDRQYDESPWFDVLRIDTNTGTLLWKKQYAIGNSNGLAGAILGRNGNIVLSGTVAQQNSSCSTWLMVEIDENGEIIWNKTYEDEVGCTFGNRIIRTNENGYATCLRQTFPTLVVLDENGNFLFSKTYELEPFMSPVDLIQLKDGSFIIVGHEGFTNKYTIWLIKTDSYGNLLLSAGKEIEKESVNIFPNPVSTTFQIELPDINIKYNAKLISSYGQLLESYNDLELNEPISIGGLANGIYYLNLFDNNELVAVKKIVKNSFR